MHCALLRFVYETLIVSACFWTLKVCHSIIGLARSCSKTPLPARVYFCSRYSLLDAFAVLAHYVATASILFVGRYFFVALVLIDIYGVVLVQNCVCDEVSFFNLLHFLLHMSQGTAMTLSHFGSSSIQVDIPLKPTCL